MNAVLCFAQNKLNIFSTNKKYFVIKLYMKIKNLFKKFEIIILLDVIILIV